MAGSTRLELATSGVTGRRSNQLNYDPVKTLQIGDCRLQILDCRLAIADCRLPIADWRLAIGDWRLLIGKLPIADCRLARGDCHFAAARCTRSSVPRRPDQPTLVGGKGFEPLTAGV